MDALHQGVSRPEHENGTAGHAAVIERPELGRLENLPRDSHVDHHEPHRHQQETNRAAAPGC